MAFPFRATLAGLVLGLCWMYLGGAAGLVTLFFYAFAVLPGILLGAALFGPSKGAARAAGALIGYGLLALAWWIPVAIGKGRLEGFVFTWLMLLLLSNAARSAVKTGALITLPEWTRRDAAALLLVLHFVPLVFGAALWRSRESGPAGDAYAASSIATEASLTREVASFDRPLHPRTAYFLPAAVLATSGQPIHPQGDSGGERIEGTLRIVALLTAICVLTLVYIVAWVATGRRWAAMMAAAIALLAASFEGLYVLNILRHSGQPFSALLDPAVNLSGRWSSELNGLAIDRLPRMMLWAQQNGAACGLGLIAVLAASREMSVRWQGTSLIGIALSFSVLFNPALGAAFLLIYVLCLAWDATTKRIPPNALLPFTLAIVLPAIALSWSWNAPAEGTAVLVAYYLTPYGSHSSALFLALGGVLIPAAVGLMPSRHVPFRPILPAAIALVLGLVLLFMGVRDARAGNLILLTVAMLIARGLVVAYQRSGSLLAMTFAAIVFLAGLPTTLIAWYTGQRLP